MDFSIFVMLSGFGLILGSFLNVVSLRMRTGMSSVKGRSKCFSCGSGLTPVELIPVLSYLFLKGRCRSCKTHISIQYPIVEFLGALSVISSFIVIRPDSVVGFVSFVGTVALFSALIVLSVYDSRHKIIPDSLSLTVLLGAFVSVSTKTGILGFPDKTHWYGMLLLPLFLLFLYVVTRGKGIGLGDAKLALGMGLFLGLSQGIAALMLAFWIGAFVSLVGLGISKVRRKHPLSFKSEVPFGPYMAIATFVSFLFHIDLNVLSNWLSF